MKKLVIFDVDGVLIQSVDTWLWAFKTAINKVGITTVSDKEIISHFGEMDKEILRKLVKSDYSSEKFKEVYQHFITLTKTDEFMNKINLVNDAKKILNTLKKRGCKLAIASGNHSLILKTLLRHFEIENLFDMIVCADDVKNGKPQPDMLIKIMDKLKFNKDNTIYIGDAPADVQAAKSAGVISVVVLTGVLSRKQAEELDPDFVIKSVVNLMNILFDGVKDLGLKEQTVGELVASLKIHGGFTSSKLAVGAEIVHDMIKDPTCTTFLSFPGCIISTGMRGIIRDMVKYKLVDVLVTTCGTLDHDIARVWEEYFHGAFEMDDKQLHKKGIHRLGNILIPQENYGLVIEEKIKPMIAEIYKEKKELSPHEFIWEVGKRINDESSILYWAWKNQIPVFVPGITDGAVGLQLWLFSQDHSDFKINLFGDEQMLSDISWNAKRTGALIIGGGISKHHTIWWNQFRGGLDYAVYVTTAVEWDGSLSGAKPREAISWGKLKEKAKEISVEGDATVILPLMMNYVWEKLKKKS